MQTETKHTKKVLEDLAAQDAPLAAELEYRWKLRSSVNAIHCQRLAELKAKSYFTGQVSDESEIMCVPNESAEKHDDLEEEERHIEAATDFFVEISE